MKKMPDEAAAKYEAHLLSVPVLTVVYGHVSTVLQLVSPLTIDESGTSNWTGRQCHHACVALAPSSSTALSPVMFSSRCSKAAIAFSISGPTTMSSLAAVS